MLVQGRAFDILPHYVERHQFIGFIYSIYYKYKNIVPLHKFDYMNVDNHLNGFFIFLKSSEQYHEMVITNSEYDKFLKEIKRDTRIDLFLC